METRVGTFCWTQCTARPIDAMALASSSVKMMMA
jgi:hypothetical protein